MLFHLFTQPRTFLATSTAGVSLGAHPVYADVDPNSGNITADSIAPLITSKTRLISVVHLAGWPADMPAICRLARQHNISVVEDCSQSHGASIKGKYTGTFSDIAIWSLCQDKIISTGGEGGIISTNSESLSNNIFALKEHGKDRELIVPGKSSAASFRFLHRFHGSNYRLTEMQAAIGTYQLSLLPDWLHSRQRNASILYEYLSPLPLVNIPVCPASYSHSFYKFYLYLSPERLRTGWDRPRIISEIISRGYFASTGSCSEVYLEESLSRFAPLIKEQTSVARRLGQTSLMLLVHPTITVAQMNAYAFAVKDVLTLACS